MSRAHVPPQGQLRTALAEALRDQSLEELARTIEVPTALLMAFLIDWKTTPAEEFLARCYNWHAARTDSVVNYPTSERDIEAELATAGRDLQSLASALHRAIAVYFDLMERARQVRPMVVRGN